LYNVTHLWPRYGPIQLYLQQEYLQKPIWDYVIEGSKIFFFGLWPTYLPNPQSGILMLKPPCFLCFLELPWIGSLQNFQRKSEMGTPPHQLKADSGTLQLLDSFCLHHFLVLAPHNLSQVMHEHCKQYFIVPNFTVWLSFVSVKFQHECDELYSVSRHHHHFPNYFLLPTLIVPLLAFSFLRPASQIPLQQTECTVLIQSIRHTL